MPLPTPIVSMNGARAGIGAPILRVPASTFLRMWSDRKISTGKGISTHAALVLAICERLQQAGVKPGNIVVWERDARSLEACGLTVSTDPSRVRCYGRSEEHTS